MENKSYDNQLVMESKLSFTNNNNINTLTLNDNGIVESIFNGKVVESFPFSKQSVNDKCIALFKEGYKLNELNTNNDNIEDGIKNNPAETKAELEQDLKDVEQIKDLKDKIDDTIDEILTESEDASDNETKPEEKTTAEDNTDAFGIVLLTKTTEDKFVPDVAIQKVNGDKLDIADTIEDVIPLEREFGESLVDTINDELGSESDWKIELWPISKIEQTTDFWNKADDENVSANDESTIENSDEDVPEANNEVVDKVNEPPTDNVAEKQESLQESISNESTFPTSEYSQKVLTPEEILNLNATYKDNLNDEQIVWINTNVDDIEYIIEGFIGLLDLIDAPVAIPFMSFDDYLFNVINEEVPYEEA